MVTAIGRSFLLVWLVVLARRGSGLNRPQDLSRHLPDRGLETENRRNCSCRSGGGLWVWAPSSDYSWELWNHPSPLSWRIAAEIEASPVISRSQWSRSVLVDDRILLAVHRLGRLGLSATCRPSSAKSHTSSSTRGLELMLPSVRRAAPALAHARQRGRSALPARNRDRVSSLRRVLWAFVAPPPEELGHSYCSPSRSRRTQRSDRRSTGAGRVIRCADLGARPPGQTTI